VFILFTIRRLETIVLIKEDIASFNKFDKQRNHFSKIKKKIDKLFLSKDITIFKKRDELFKKTIKSENNAYKV